MKIAEPRPIKPQYKVCLALSLQPGGEPTNARERATRLPKRSTQARYSSHATAALQHIEKRNPSTCPNDICRTHRKSTQNPMRGAAAFDMAR